jgi:hypothetical protein
LTVLTVLTVLWLPSSVGWRVSGFRGSGASGEGVLSEGLEKGVLTVFWGPELSATVSRRGEPSAGRVWRRLEGLGANGAQAEPAVARRARDTLSGTGWDDVGHFLAVKQRGERNQVDFQRLAGGWDRRRGLAKSANA